MSHSQGAATPDSGGLQPSYLDAKRALYIHLAFDGGIFVVWGKTGRQAWLTQPQLEQELRRAKAEGGLLLYSRDAPDNDPPTFVTETFERILSYRLPIKLLAESHQTPAAHARQDLTILMIASHQGHEHLAADLIARGVPLEARSRAGHTALMLAANGGKEKIVRLLLDGGTDPNAQDNQGSAPLMFAARHGYDGIVGLLLERGANPAVRGQHGNTAASLAKQNGHASTHALLEAPG